MLARVFLQQYGAAYAVGPQRLSQAAEAWLLAQPWPGNVRELSHLLERVALLETAMVIDPESLARLCLTPSGSDASAVSRRTSTPGAPPHERERLAEVLRQTGGNLAAAARLLGLSRSGLRHRLYTYGLTRPSRHQVFPPIRQDTSARETPTPSAAHPTVVPARGVEPPMVPASQRGEGQGVGTSGRRDERRVGVTGTSLEPSMGWVPKPVAVLAIEVTWPAMWEAEGRPYEPWTVAGRWSEIIAEKVEGFGGVMLQDSPALCMVAFGLPKTLEQLPQRAVQAALAIRHLTAETHPFAGEMPSPAVRLTAHLGTLLVAEGTGEPSWRWLAVGETLALPVRLLGHAVAGEILVSAEVGRLVEGWCECQPHGGPAGIESLLVRGLTPRSSSLRLHGRRPLSRFVGRERELATLTDLLTQATEGRGQVAGIVGEPGIGKSRLLYEMHQYLREQPVPYFEGQCLSYGQAIPLMPVLTLLQQHSSITEADTPEAVAAKVRLTLQTAGIDPEEGAPYLFQLLGLQAGIDRLAHLSPEVRKTRTFETLRQLYLTSSQQHPLVLAVENLHWIDPTSEAFLASLIEYLAGSRLFVLFTYRPGYRPPWIDKSYATQMVLPPLSARDSRRMLASVLPTDTISATMEQQILAKAQGNPFFLEEIAQMLVQQGTLKHDGGMTLPPTMQLPATVQEVLGARIDRLPADEKALLQTLAVIGQVCSRRLLMRIVAQPEAEVSPRLSNLQAAELLYEQPASPEPTVTFKHVLTQEVAYHTLSQARQRTLHQRTAQAIEALVSERQAEHYSELAYHYSRSDNMQKAVVYLQRAGQQAADRSAYRESIIHLTQGLGLLPHLPDAQERSRQELDLLITLGHALIATKGQAAPAVEQAFTRARGLCEQLGETSQLAAVLGGLRAVYEVRGELPKARELAEQMLGLAQREQEPARLMQAYIALGQTLFYLGAFAPARAYLEQGMALDDPTRDRSGAVRFSSQIQGVNGRRYAAWTLWYLGYPEQARQRSHEAIALAQKRTHPYSVAYALHHAAVLHCLRREAHAAQARAESEMELARQQELPLMVARGTFPRGWALAVQGQQAEGIALIRQGMDAEGMMGGVQRPYRLAMLAEIYGQIGQTAEALRLMAEALVLTHQYGGHFYAAEVHRLTGELLLQHAGGGVSGSPRPELSMREGYEGEGPGPSPRPTEAETWFHQALDIARRQQAKSLELRAAVSLSRLWQQQDKPTAAYQLLAPIYDWFTEGFDTADLQEAKVLLETLS